MPRPSERSSTRSASATAPSNPSASVSLRLYRGQKQALYDRLAQQLRQMRDSGEIALIHNRYGVAPPDSVG